MRQLVYTMFVSYDHASFNLWWIKSLVKYQKVSKYYAVDCRSIHCTKKAKNVSFLFQIFSWDMKSFLAYLLSILFLNAKHLVRKLFFDFLNLQTSQMGGNFIVLFHHLLSLNWSGYLLKCRSLALRNFYENNSLCMIVIIIVVITIA